MKKLLMIAFCAMPILCFAAPVHPGWRCSAEAAQAYKEALLKETPINTARVAVADALILIDGRDIPTYAELSKICQQTGALAYQFAYCRNEFLNEAYNDCLAKQNYYYLSWFAKKIDKINASPDELFDTLAINAINYTSADYARAVLTLIPKCSDKKSEDIKALLKKMNMKYSMELIKADEKNKQSYEQLVAEIRTLLSLY